MSKTRLGQHFLTDENVLEKECAVADLSSDDIVLEIGPGKGFLTQRLAEKVQKVIAVELDTQLYQMLKQTLPENVILIHGDILKINWDEIPFFSKIVSNLPYQISSPFTFKLFETTFEKAVLIYQKEFAERMIATAGMYHYSRLSVGVAYNAECKIIQDVPPDAFFPSPNIFSSIVELIPFKSPPFNVIDESFFLKITKILFMHRRKQIKTTLKKAFKTDISDAIRFGSKRVEMISPKDIGLLSNTLYPYRKYLKH